MLTILPVCCRWLARLQCVVSRHRVSGDEWPQAVVLAIWGTVVVSGIDNVLRPRLVAGRTGLSKLAMFFALLGRLQVFGGLGLVLGPVVFAAAVSLIDALREPNAVATPVIDTATNGAGSLIESLKDLPARV